MEPDRRRPPRPSRDPFTLDEADRRLLEFLAEHRLVRTDHLQTLLDVPARAAERRVVALAGAGFVHLQAVFAGQPPGVRVTARGLAAIGSDLPTPRVNLGAHRHDVGVAWLWLAARAGTFGPLREVIGERRMRSSDGPGRRSDPRLAVRLGALGPRGEERLHYPDLLLITEDGRRIAVELELTGKGRARRERILAAYGADPRVDAVLYLVTERAMGTAIATSARRLGLSGRVMVQGVAMADPTVPAEADASAERTRPRDRGRGGGRDAGRGRGRAEGAER